MTPDYATVGMVIGALIIILQAASLVVGIWSRLRRQPPIDRELANFVKRDEFSKLAEQMREDVGKLSELIRNNTRELGEWRCGIERQIGRLESDPKQKQK